MNTLKTCDSPKFRALSSKPAVRGQNGPACVGSTRANPEKYPYSITLTPRGGHSIVLLARLTHVDRAGSLGRPKPVCREHQRSGSCIVPMQSGLKRGT